MDRAMQNDVDTLEEISSVLDYWPWFSLDTPYVPPEF
jgi:hypothetical protein